MLKLHLHDLEISNTCQLSFSGKKLARPCLSRPSVLAADVFCEGDRDLEDFIDIGSLTDFSSLSDEEWVEVSAWGQDDSVIFREPDSDEVYTTPRGDWSESVYEWNGNPC